MNRYGGVLFSSSQDEAETRGIGFRKSIVVGRRKTKKLKRFRVYGVAGQHVLYVKYQCYRLLDG